MERDRCGQTFARKQENSSRDDDDDDDDDAVITDACEPYGFQHAGPALACGDGFFAQRPAVTWLPRHAVTTRSRLLLRRRDAAFLSGLLYRLW
ncbi:hypothetical protein MY1884_000632 [Beauveria asiatica]